MFKKLAIAAAAALAFAPAAQSATFSDLNGFQMAVGAGIMSVETFDGAASSIVVPSTGNAIGSGLTLDSGGTSSFTGMGLNGTGELVLRVGATTNHTLSLAINFATPLMGFGFVIEGANGGAFMTQEVAVGTVNTPPAIISDIIGLSDSSDGNSVTQQAGGPQFIGFTSATPFSSVTFQHGDLVALGAVFGGIEDFRISTAYLAETLAPVPLPAGMPLLLVALGGLGLLRRRRKAALAA